MSKINGGLQTHARRRRGLRPRARMVLDLIAAEGRAGREKGHRWAEALSSVKVLKVNGVSVKLTRCFPPILQVKRDGYVTGCLWHPQLCL